MSFLDDQRRNETQHFTDGAINDSAALHTIGDDLNAGFFIGSRQFRAEDQALASDVGDGVLCGGASDDVLFRSERFAEDDVEHVNNFVDVSFLDDQRRNETQNFTDGAIDDCAALHTIGDDLNAGFFIVRRQLRAEQ